MSKVHERLDIIQRSDFIRQVEDGRRRTVAWLVRIAGGGGGGGGVPRSEIRETRRRNFGETAVRTTLFTKDEVNLVSLPVTGDACKLATYRVLDLPGTSGFILESPAAGCARAGAGRGERVRKKRKRAKGS